MKYLLIIIFIFYIVGCSSNQPKEVFNQQPVIDSKLVSTGKSELRLYRPNAQLQRFVGANISLDNRYLITLANKNKYKTRIKPGQHTLSIKGGALDMKSGCKYQITLKPGEIKYISISPSTAGAALPIVSILANPLVCKFEIQEVSMNKGKQEYEALIH